MQEKSSLLVSTSNVGARGRQRWYVRGVNLEVHRGEIVTLIGPNGAGKTTTARLALGLLKPAAGQVWRAPNLRVAYAPQRLSIDWTLPLSVARFMRLTQGLSEAETRSALATTGVERLYHEPLQGLSGGEFQRVQLARALARKPDLLVLDEPSQGVDVAGEAQLYTLIAQIRDQINCGVLLISHNLHLVMAQTDTVLCLNGHVCCSGSPQTVSMDPAFLALYGPEATHAFYPHGTHSRAEPTPSA